MSTLFEHKETFTYTSPKGIVFVITDVPALVCESEDGVREVRFAPASSRIINKYIKEGLKLYNTPSVYAASFEQAKRGFLVDAQVRFVGGKIGINTTPLDVWRLITYNLKKSYDLIKKAYQDVKEVERIAYPDVVPGAGSLIIGLKAHHRPPMFESDSELDNLITDEIQILQLFIDGYAFMNGQTVESELLLSHPEIQMGVVRAIEKLSPTEKSEIKEVQIIPKSKLFTNNKTVAFTYETHAKAAHWIKEKKEENPSYREVIIVGQIDTLKRTGEMTIKDVEYNYPDFKKYQTKALFTDNLWEQLVFFFRQKDKRVLFRGVEFEINGVWSNQPMVKYVEEAPSFEEVERAASGKIELA